MSAPAPFAREIAATYAMTDTFEAWRLRDTETATSIGISATTLADALSHAQNSCGHGDTLLILQTHARTERQTLHAFRIRQGARELRRIGDDPVPQWIRPLKPDAMFSMAVDAFTPVAPFRWSPGADVIGIDRREVVS